MHLKLYLSLFLLTATACAQSVGEYEIRKRTSSGFTSYGVTLANGQALGQLAGVPAAITIGGTGVATWGTIEGTLADQIDLKAALDAKQVTITDGSLTIARTSGLQDALDAKVPVTRTINGNALSSDVTITTITGNAGTATALQTARTINGVSFNGTADITITAAGSTLSDTVPIAKGGSGATTAAAARTALGLAIGTDVQPHTTILDQLSALADSVGVPVYDGTGFGVTGCIGLSYGSKGAADASKIPFYGNAGELVASTAIYIYGDTTHSAALRAPAGADADLTIPAAIGTLAITSDITVANLGGLGTGIAAALAINTGSAGAPVLFNGALGTPSSGTATNLSGTATSLTSGQSTAALGLKTASTTVSVSSATAPTAGQRLTATSSTAADWEFSKAEIVVACSDETTALTTGTAKVTFRMPHAMTLTSVRLQVNTAPTGSVIIVDVKEAGTTIFSTKPQIATSAFTSVGGAVPGTLSDTALADDAEITINIDQIGSTIAGKGLKVTLIGTRP